MNTKTVKKEASKYFEEILNGKYQIYFDRDDPNFDQKFSASPDSYFQVSNEWVLYFDKIKSLYEIRNTPEIKSRIESMLIFILKGTLNYYHSLNEVKIFDPMSKAHFTVPRASIDGLCSQSKLLFEKKDFNLENFSPLSTETITFVKKGDCLELAREIIEQGTYSKVAMLNMASDVRPNGGSNLGHWAQEENITRRSNYYLSLHMNLRSEYPMPSYSATYSPGVYVFRDTEENGYSLLLNPFLVDIIGVSAPNMSRSDTRSYLYTIDLLRAELRRRLKIIFQIAIENQIEVLVLGAIGCGAFRNPPDVVSEIILELVEEFASYIKVVCFAILENRRDREDPLRNYKTFQMHFGDEQNFKTVKGKVKAKTKPSENIILESQIIQSRDKDASRQQQQAEVGGTAYFKYQKDFPPTPSFTNLAREQSGSQGQSSQVSSGFNYYAGGYQAQNNFEQYKGGQGPTGPAPYQGGNIHQTYGSESYQSKQNSYLEGTYSQPYYNAAGPLQNQHQVPQKSFSGPPYYQNSGYRGEGAAEPYIKGPAGRNDDRLDAFKPSYQGEGPDPYFKGPGEGAAEPYIKNPAGRKDDRLDAFKQSYQGEGSDPYFKGPGEGAGEPYIKNSAGRKDDRLDAFKQSYQGEGPDPYFKGPGEVRDDRLNSFKPAGYQGDGPDPFSKGYGNTFNNDYKGAGLDTHKSGYQGDGFFGGQGRGEVRDDRLDIFNKTDPKNIGINTKELEIQESFTFSKKLGQNKPSEQPSIQESFTFAKKVDQKKPSNSFNQILESQPFTDFQNQGKNPMPFNTLEKSEIFPQGGKPKINSQEQESGNIFESEIFKPQPQPQKDLPKAFAMANKSKLASAEEKTQRVKKNPPPKCQKGFFCIYDKNNAKQHFTENEHGYGLPLCKSVENCRNKSEEHLEKFIHFCGENCRELRMKDADHCRLYIHISN